MADFHLSNNQIVIQEKRGVGEFSGDATASSKYGFSFYRGDSYTLLYVKAELTVSSNSGAADYYGCLLTYNIIGTLPEIDIETLAEIVHVNAPIDLERMFIEYRIWQPMSPLDGLWHPLDRQRARVMLKMEIDSLLYS